MVGELTGPGETAGNPRPLLSNGKCDREREARRVLEAARIDFEAHVSACGCLFVACPKKLGLFTDVGTAKAALKAAEASL